MMFGETRRVQFLGGFLLLCTVLATSAPACGEGGGSNVNESTELSGPAGLVAAYGFEEGTGDRTADGSGHGNVATLTAAAWSASGRYGRALAFNGTSSWATVPESSSLDLSNGMTLEAWVKPNKTTGWRAVLVKEQTNDLAYAMYSSNASDLPNAIVYTRRAEREADDPSPLAAGTWKHLAATYDGAWVRLYENGNPVAQIAASGSIPTSSGPLRIGGDALWGEHFDGLIDEVRVYSRALSSAEIQADMARPVGQTQGDAGPPGDSGGGGSSSREAGSGDGGATGDGGGTTGDAGSQSGGSPTRFVAPTGDDANPCSQSLPCVSFDRAYRVASPGDIVAVAAGNYPQQIIRVDASKTSPDDVVFEPATGANVVIGCNSGNQSCIDVFGSHVTIRGMHTADFTLNGAPYQGRIDTERSATDITFDRMDVGAVAIGSSDTTIENCDLGPSIDPFNNRQADGAHNLWFNNLVHDYVIAQGGHMECLTWDGGTDITIRGNEWRSCVVFGIFAKPVENVSGTIDGNWFWNPRQQTIQDDVKISTGSGADTCSVAVTNNWFSEGFYDDCPGVTTSGNTDHDPSSQPPGTRP